MEDSRIGRIMNLGAFTVILFLFIPSRINGLIETGTLRTHEVSILRILRSLFIVARVTANAVIHAPAFSYISAKFKMAVLFKIPLFCVFFMFSSVLNNRLLTTYFFIIYRIGHLLGDSAFYQIREN